MQIYISSGCTPALVARQQTAGDPVASPGERGATALELPSDSDETGLQRGELAGMIARPSRADKVFRPVTRRQQVRRVTTPGYGQ